MRPAIVVICAITAYATAAPAIADMWECDEPGGGKRFTQIEADAAGCKQLTITPKPLTAEQKQKILEFRGSIKSGIYSSIGLVVEVKRPIALVQTRIGQRWYRVDELFPPN